MSIVSYITSGFPRFTLLNISAKETSPNVEMYASYPPPISTYSADCKLNCGIPEYGKAIGTLFRVIKAASITELLTIFVIPLIKYTSAPIVN